MKKLVRNIFKIYKGESSKLLGFFIFAVLFQFIVTIGLSVSDAVFLSKVGTKYLPYFFIVSPFVMALFIAVYSHFTGKIGIEKTIRYTFIILLLAGILIYYIPTFYKGDSNWLYSAIKMYAYLWFLSSYSLFWNYIDEYYALLDAKRLYPYLAAGLTTGGILAGVLVSNFAGILKYNEFFLIGSVVAFLGIFMHIYLSKKYERIEEEVEEPMGVREQTSSVVEYIKKSKFILVIVLVLFFTIFLTTLAEFQYSKVFEKNYTNENDLIAFLGNLFIWVNIANLVINIFVFGRLVSSLGIPNVALIQPITYIIVFVSFLIQGSNSEVAAIMAFFAYYSIMLGIDFNNWNFLFNAIPYKIRKTIRFVLEGVMDPLASGIAGVCLLGIIWYVAGSINTDSSEESTYKHTFEFISQIAFFISLGFVVLVFFFKKQYSKAILDSLQYGSLNFRNKIYFKNKIPRENLINILEKKNKKNFKTVFLILWENDYKETLTVFIKMLKEFSLKEQKLLLDVMDIILEDKDLHIRRRLIQEFRGNPIHLIPEFGKFFVVLDVMKLENHIDILNRRDLTLLEKETYTISLWNSWDITNNEKALKVIQIMLDSSEIEQVKIAIHLIGYLKDAKYINLITKFIKSKHPSLAKETILTMCRLIDENNEQFFIPLVKELVHLDVDSRICILEALFRIKDANIIKLVLLESYNLTVTEQRLVQDVSIRMGLYIIPLVVSMINDLSLPYATRVISARILCTLSFPQFENIYKSIVKQEILYAYETLYYSQVLSKVSHKTQGMYVLEKFYSGVSRLSVSFVLDILALGGRMPNIDMITSFLHSNSIKERNNAIEALSQSIAPDLIKPIIPLIDSRSILEQLDYYKKKFNKKEISVDEILDKALQEKFPLEKSTAFHLKYEENLDPNIIKKYKDLFVRDNNPLCHQVLLDVIEFDKNKKTQHIGVIQQFYCLFQAEFFKKLKLSNLEQLFHISKLEFLKKKGTVLFQKGDSLSSIYLVIQGSLSEVKNKQENIIKVYDIIGIKECFVLDRKVESKVSTIEENTVLMTFDYDKFSNLAKVFPILALQIMESVN